MLKLYKNILSGDSVVKNPFAIHEIRVWYLGWENPMEKEMANFSSIFAWKSSWTQENGWLQCMRSQRVGYDWATKQQQQQKEEEESSLII